MYGKRKFIYVKYSYLYCKKYSLASLKMLTFLLSLGKSEFFNVTKLVVLNCTIKF